MVRIFEFLGDLIPLSLEVGLDLSGVLIIYIDANVVCVVCGIRVARELGPSTITSSIIRTGLFLPKLTVAPVSLTTHVMISSPLLSVWLGPVPASEGTSGSASVELWAVWTELTGAAHHVTSKGLSVDWATILACVVATLAEVGGGGVISRNRYPPVESSPAKQLRQINANMLHAFVSSCVVTNALGELIDVVPHNGVAADRLVSRFRIEEPDAGDFPVVTKTFRLVGAVALGLHQMTKQTVELGIRQRHLRVRLSGWYITVLFHAGCSRWRVGHRRGRNG
ncbi:hypothetical protein Trco_007413 [Trichoderma cornu-damae]|uniref:Uncharacterized protein n=1 Tax=Trichoderma cornu-damae TaxID=654480 RepID=A0A9P8TTE5_9HYPO|nr:hypothetical protein Trco_007413 [Trichoderma cornu-damae]